jgi:uncharacterized protein (UPF0179 family)
MQIPTFIDSARRLGRINCLVVRRPSTTKLERKKAAVGSSVHFHHLKAEVVRCNLKSARNRTAYIVHRTFKLWLSLQLGIISSVKTSFLSESAELQKIMFVPLAAWSSGIVSACHQTD